MEYGGSVYSRRKDTSGYDMELVFKYGDKEFRVSVDIPFTIFMEALRQYCYGHFVINLDGTDSAVWNFLVEFDAIEKIAYNNDFIEMCKELYLESSFYEDDYEQWKDDYESDHELGDYAPKKDEEE